MPKFDAVIFDLDGVITKTALVHSAAWKKTFDEYLLERENKYQEAFREFTHAEDYLNYVDGKPRYKGVASFLDSRGIELSFGDPNDDPSQETICGLGNRKNHLFNEVLATEGVEVYDSTIVLIKDLLSKNIRVGVASSSKNCKPVLESAGLLALFETRIDGVVSIELGLKGKPEPDIFTTACDRLGVKYNRSVVVEDAVSGVQAGKNGNFGLVIGVARENNARELLTHGADIVVEDLDEINPDNIDKWFSEGIQEDQWTLKYLDYDLEKERSRETLLAIGNGYYGTRGALEESSANQVNYPGTYFSGLFNRKISKVAEREIENEDLVNIINWLPVTFKIDDGPWLEFQPDPNFTLSDLSRCLDFRTGELIRSMIVEDGTGRKTSLVSRRFFSMSDPHTAGLSYCLKPLNYSGKITIRSELRGDHINAGVERYKQLEQDHLEPLSEFSENNTCRVEVKTSQSGIKVVAVSRQTISSPNQNKHQSTYFKGKAWAAHELVFEAEKNREIRFEKLVGIYNSLETSGNITQEAEAFLTRESSYQEQLNTSIKAWSEIWNRIDIRIAGDRMSQKLVRLHLYHMMVTASPHHANLDFGIPPRGLHGEAYRGHIFWDELYILPLYSIHFPEVTRSVLLYRYRRLDKARSYARENGYKGAMFPWQSGSDGREETQVVHLNPLSGEWGEDYSSLQRHVSLAIAYNIWTYYRVTNDLEFLEQYGAEMYLDICRFWASAATKDNKSGRFHIDRVMGPDEFHEKLPGADTGGLTDNAYTNIMVSWMLEQAEEMIRTLSPGKKAKVFQKLDLQDTEINHWYSIKDNLSLHISEDGIIGQFKGYFDLKELDWEDYKSRYEDIHRLDRILKAEGKSPDEYKLSKQADLLMAFFNLGEQQVTSVIKNLGYKPGRDYFRKNYDYYVKRTSHGSTLSRLVHANLAYTLNRNIEACELYLDALKSDLVDIQGGTTGEGIHCGVMAGTVYFILSVFAGLKAQGTHLELCPKLPDLWEGLIFKFTHRATDFEINITKDKLDIKNLQSDAEKIYIRACKQTYELKPGKTITIHY